MSSPRARAGLRSVHYGSKADTRAARIRANRVCPPAAAILFCFGIVAGPAAFGQLPDGPGRDATLQVCGNCHEVGILLQHRQSREDWISTIRKMIDAGAEGTEEQFNAVLEYVSKNLGPTVTPVNVNKAAAAELESAIGLSSKEAAAIVKYRSEKGAFKTIEDLKKVPDLDFKKIEAQKERLVF